MRRLLVAGAIIAIGAVCGCREVKPTGYYGPTDPFAKVVADINRNNQAIPTLFAHHYVEAKLWDPAKKQSRFINADGNLFVRKPRELLMTGSKDIAGDIFEMGSDTERYWFKVFQTEKTEWWGWHRNAGKPCAAGMPIQPDLVLEVLGIGDINTNFLQPPFPTMRFNNDFDVYMLVWNAQLPDRWYAQKEIWYSRKTLLPLKVLLFDQNGRIILHANLTDHKPVKLVGTPEANWPKIATHYDLFFPEDNSTMKPEDMPTMKLTLSDMVLTSPSGQPKEGGIRFRESDPKIQKVIQIDKDCDK